ERTKFLSADRIPEFHRSIQARRNHARSVRVERNVCQSRRVTLEDEEFAAAGHIPEPRIPTPNGARDEPRTIRTKRQVCNEQRTIRTKRQVCNLPRKAMLPHRMAVECTALTAALWVPKHDPL